MNQYVTGAVIRELREKKKMTQADLAGALKVSDKTVSKWETGKAIPESDTLVSISEYFRVTLDYLMRENAAAGSEPDPAASRENGRPSTDTGSRKRLPGIVICVSGTVCLIIWGLVSVFIPSASNQISESSAITVDGNGIFLAICLAAVVAGAVLLLRSTSNK